MLPDLIEQIKSGDRSAFHGIFNEYYSDLCKFAASYVKDRDAAEDIVQDFFVRFWIGRNEISIKSSLKSYLFTSIRNRSLNYLRDNNKTIKLDENIDYLNNILPGNSSEDIENSEMNLILHDAINKLPAKCKEIFYLCKIKQLSYKEIAEKLEISPKTVENQMGIAFKKLHEILKPYMNSLIALFITLYLFF